MSSSEQSQIQDRPISVREIEAMDDIERVTLQIARCETILTRVREVKLKLRDLMILVREYTVSLHLSCVYFL